MGKVEYYSETRWLVICNLVSDQYPLEVSAGRCEDGSEVLEFKETECNGQEDTHLIGVLVRDSKDHDWEWEGGDKDESKDHYQYKGFGKDIRQFFKDNPPPEEVYAQE